MPLANSKRRHLAPIAAVYLFVPGIAAAGTSQATELNNRAVASARAGKFEQAIGDLRQALRISPDDATAQKNLSGILGDYAKQQEKRASTEQLLQWLEEAAALDGKNGPAWAMLGDLHYYAQNDPAASIAAWQRAVAVAPGSVARALSDRIVRVQRDLSIERDYEAIETEHFVIKVQEGRALDLNQLSLLLEEAHAQLKSELGLAPENLTVIVYTEQSLKRVSGKRDWAIGLYDGRLRLRVDELTAPLLPDLVSHELAHAFLHRIYGYSLPVWVHEGFAQMHETEAALRLRSKPIEDSLKSKAGWVPLKWLDRRFQQPSNSEDLLRAYAQARIVVEKMIARQGMQSFARFLSLLGQRMPADAAFEQSMAPLRWGRFEQGIFD